MLRLKRSNFERPASNGPSLSPGTCLIRSLRSGRFLFSPYGLSPQEVPADCLQEILPCPFFGGKSFIGMCFLNLKPGFPQEQGAAAPMISAFEIAYWTMALRFVGGAGACADPEA